MNRVTQNCDLADDYIVLYALDDLRGARREFVEAHINACPACRRKLAEFQGLTQLLQQSAPVTGDPLHRAHIKAEIAHKTERRQPASRMSWRPVLMVGILLILTVAFLAPEMSRADFPLGRVIGVLTEPARNVPRVISGAQDQPGTLPSTPEPLGYYTADLPSRPVAPSELPFGLELIDQTWPYSQDVVSRYENATGLAVELIQTPTAASDLALSPTIETVMILNTTVMQHTSPEPGAIAALYWVRDGFVFQLSPLRAPYGGLVAEDAYLIVRAIMHAQDAVP